MEQSLTVQQLIMAAKAGDREAFRVLYELLAPKVFRFIRPRARTREDALDVLQETFIDLWKGLSTFSYQGDASLDAFLYTIASRKLARLFRWWKPTVSLESLDDVFVAPGMNEHEEGTVLAIAHALRSLRAADREILVLRHMEGRSFSDIAELLGQSENTLKVRHHRALGRLRQIVQYD